jgi:hypothetical protein
MADWDTVREIGLTLPDVAESTWYGTAALKARGKAMCRLRDEGATLVVRVGDLDERELLLSSDPDVLLHAAALRRRAVRPRPSRGCVA